MEGKREYAKHIARWMLSTILGVSARKKMCFFPEREPKIGESLEESLR